MSWELPAALTTIILSVFGFWWFHNPQSGYQRAIYALVCALALLANPRPLLVHMYSVSYDAFLQYRLYVFLIQNFKMVLTLGAVVWLLHRSWQTLWKPVPDLINVLGVDVPESPDVSLAGIRADAATLSWTRPTGNRPVQKYSIQVNGVPVGDSPGNEIAITVTGLKPNHFYNIRVVAVGPNNFRAGSPVIRLRTFGKDGKPNLGNSRLPTNFAQHDHAYVAYDNESDDSDAPKNPLPSVEAAPVIDSNPAGIRDAPVTTIGQRRNTLNRRHSPSVASMDQPQIRHPPADGPELSLDELNRKFENIRKEIDDTLSLYAKEEAEFLQQEEVLRKEKDKKRQSLKEKEEQTTQLKAAVRTTMEQMRSAEKERSRKEQQLKDKENKKSKVWDTISKHEKDIERMKMETAGFETQRIELQERRNKTVLELDEANADLQEKCAALESELKDKGKQLQDMKEAREQLPGANDDQSKETETLERRNWDLQRKEMHGDLVAEIKKAHQLDQHIRILTEQLAVQHQSGLAFYNNQAESANIDTHHQVSTQPKRLSHGSMVLGNNSNGLNNGSTISLSNQFPAPDPSFPGAAGFSHQAFAPGLFMNMDRSNEPQSEAELKAQGGPLSPSASSLLPSDIFEDTEAGPKQKVPSSFVPEAMAATEDFPQSPASSSRSLTTGLPSPHGSSHHLPFPQYVDSGDQRSLNLVGSSPVAAPASGHRFTSLLSSFQRSRGAKPADEDGLPVGSLKAGQSQSFPRGADENDPAGNKRRISFSFMNRNSMAGDGVPITSALGSRVFPTRRFNTLANSASSMFSSNERDESRPASIASTELPRPSTDSSSIWAPAGDGSGLAKNRLWSPNDARWGSRSGSRRQSLHGSPSILETTLASADDEILDDYDIRDPQSQPSQIGVIGSRPPPRTAASKVPNQNLNPNAPTFMGFPWRKDKDKDREVGLDTDKPKGKGKGKEVVTPSIEHSPHLDESPSDSRMSRDTFSVHTQTSVSESHESLQLDTTTSKTPSDVNPSSIPATKDAENAVRKLFRKGSSSKFSLSSRLVKDSSLFKKGPPSSTTSDKNLSAEHRSSIGDVDDLGEDISQLARSYDSVTSSPSLGPAKSKDSKESRMSAWRFSMKKKGKDTPSREQESLEMDRATDEV